jgi:HNH endonuclease
MRCIFCKSDSTKSRSIEHIIPESLGNIEHILPRGVVCDTCNNYFARKVEGPLLETPWFRHARSRQWVPNKRGLTPPMTGLVPGARMPAHVWWDGPNLTLEGRNEREQHALTDVILTRRANTAYIPIIEAIDQRLMSRFLAKVALEVLTRRVLCVEGWSDEIVDKEALDPLRHFARVGDRPKKWPFSRRRIYGEDDLQEEDGASYQVLHEFTILCEPLPEPGHLHLYVVVCIFGEEFAINMGEPEIAGYERWLTAHDGKSPLYISDKLPAGSVFG